MHDQVLGALAPRIVKEFAGIEPNPYYETLQQASTFARANGCNFVLGVGGGSVIDAAKFLSMMIATGMDDPWDALVGDRSTVAPITNGAVLTLPTMGSESNPVSVISSLERRLKVPFTYQMARPVFA
ncbi:iron-containing alcohol dehydrogenase [Brucella cytisi]|uniref:iron-containing alcohol dehydrogenase n=1 Tax=Brucella cytisi TaxID=407152 RepID=UPI0035D576E4